MCYPCKNCGRCRPKFEANACVVCGTMNDDNYTACKECGFVRPAKPGQSNKIKLDTKTAQTQAKGFKK